MSTKESSHRRIAVLIVLSMLLSLAAPLVPGTGQSLLAAKADLKLQTDQAHAGDKVKAEGVRFPKDAQAQLVWEADQSLLAEFQTRSDGRFEVEFTVPAAAPGTYKVKVNVLNDREGSVVEDTDSIDVIETVAPTNTPAPPTEVPQEPTNTPEAHPTEGDTSDPATNTPEAEVDTSTPESDTGNSTGTPTGEGDGSSTPQARVAALSGDTLTFPIRATFYYPWFPNAWNQGGVYPFTNYTPSNGFYDGGDPAVISQQIAAMQYGGIQAGISSWWGQGHHTDARFPALLAGAAGTGFKWTVYHEGESLGDPSVSSIRSDLTYLRDKYAEDPSYLRIDGKFVVFVYADGGDNCGMVDRWEEANTVGAYIVLKVFSGYTNCGKQPDSWHQYSPAVAADSQGKYSYSISPGFWLKGQSVRLSRDLARFQQNVRDMASSGANWQLVVSFNEWGEGTSVESAKEWDSPSGYGDYLDALNTNGTGASPQPTPKPNTPAPTPQPLGKYTLAGSARSSNSTEPRAVWDDNFGTTWQSLEGIAAPSSAHVYVSLGAVKPIATIRWVFGIPDIADSMAIQVSDDHTTWTTVHKAGNAKPGTWQRVDLDGIKAKYVRFYFANPNRDPMIGGLAEVEIYAPNAFNGSEDPIPMPTKTATPAPTKTPTSGTGGVAFAPVADARVEENAPSQNFGSSSYHFVDGDSGLKKRTYLRFDVTGLSTSVSSAKLRLYVRAGTQSAPKIYLASNSWDEKAISWNNRPGVSGATTAGSGALAVGTWVELDVTGLVTTNGTVTLALVASSNDGVTFASREDTSRAPQLILNGGPAPQPTAQQSATPKPTSTAQPTGTPGGASDGFVVNPIGDARVEEPMPDQNFGSSTVLSVDAGTGTRERSYLYFDVKGLSTTVASAKLRLYVRSGTKTAPSVYRSTASWVEASITWSNRPGVSGNSTAGSGTLADGTWVELDVTGLVTGNGGVTLVLVATSDDGVTFASREDASRKPELILVEGTAPQPTTTRPAPTATNPAPTATRTASPTPNATQPSEAGDRVLLAAGDIADCGSPGDEATAKLLGQNGGTIATLGDNVYNDGTAAQFRDCFDPTWGQYKSRIKPSAGNHDYHTSGATGYYGYFGSAAGDPKKGYYSYDLGSWHIVALNSNCGNIGGCTASSPQGTWLKSDLAAHSNSCTLAYWHHPLFSSGNHGSSSATRDLWNLLYQGGAEVVLMGHDHHYERFAPQTSTAGSDSQFGIRGFVVGTGGRGLYNVGSAIKNSEVRYNGGWGILKLVLGSGSYSWQFLSVPGKTFTDSGSGKCHGVPGSAAIETGSEFFAGTAQLDLANTALVVNNYSGTFQSLPPVALVNRKRQVRKVLKRRRIVSQATPRIIRARGKTAMMRA